MRKAGLDETQAGIKIAGRNNNLSTRRTRPYMGSTWGSSHHEKKNYGAVKGARNQRGSRTADFNPAILNAARSAPKSIPLLPLLKANYAVGVRNGEEA